MNQNSDFSKGSVSRNILQLAVPITVAQLINVLYNIVDRMYIGHLPESASSALTGVGLTFPIITIIIAFANLFGMGGAPLFSIARGRGEPEEAAEIMSNTFCLLLGAGVIITVVVLLFKRPLLYLFGASDVTFPFADDYLTIYLLGTVFVMLGLGMNNFINAQGFGRIGMITVLLGAIINIVLDPLFIFVFHLGVRGAAIATVISQFISAFWAVSFLLGKKTLLRIQLRYMRLKTGLVKQITFLGLSGFFAQATNSAVQIVCNATLQTFGGDLYVGVMTILNSVREITISPVTGITNASQPVISFNYGAEEYKRVREGIKFMSILCVAYTLVIWLAIILFPQLFICIFTSDQQLIAASIPSMHIFFFGIFMMALQYAGQATSVALGRSKQSIFFSLLRKVVIVIPLTLLLPNWYNLGVNGVFVAEPISNFLGGGACFITMLLTIWREMARKERQKGQLPSDIYP